MNREHPEGSGDNEPSILDREWISLTPENKDRHINYLKAIARYSYDRRMNPERIKIIMENADCDISIIPHEIHDGAIIEENMEF